ncbi:hypothetical protein LSH36_316g08008 [Paralvinella palmiformis]|uniref:Major facilitator superfamily (MFS) profile domain-containing protein n=1 Tax=Paralvinella palmiformis TaxID=53620 RepID=A0AAD9JHI8_9ANNE|nr:hypothetical protein LSH36_316g08008 [Paralvinella palmiformis]
MDFEEVIDQLGSFGYWQRVVFFIISVADIFGAFSMLVMVFTGATPKWTCNAYVSNNVTITAEHLPNTTDLMTCSVNDSFACTNFTFHDDFTSIVSEWNLICGRRYVSDMITSIQMVGLILGAGLFGQLSDSIGRKKAYFLAFTIMIGFGFISAFSPVWEMFAFCRFFVGVGFGATMVVSCVYPLEFVGQRWRTLCGTIGFWAIGGMVLALCGYLLRPWNYLIILTSASGVLYYIAWFFVPESPRWLALRDRFDEAEAIFLKIAKKNKVAPPCLTGLKEFVTSSRNEEQQLKHYTYLHLFKTWKYSRMSLILILVWFTVFIMYYGLAYNMRNMSGNRYLNMFLAGFLDLAAMLAVILFNNVIGRRFAQLLFLLIAITADVIIIGVIISDTKEKLSNLILASALIGKASALAGTYVVQIWTAELFPTVIRNQAVGIGSVSARIGSMLSPQIVFLGEFYYLAPYIITISLCILCIPLLFLLAETNGQPLDDEFKGKSKTKLSSNKTEIKL